jgi:hypothetical protein
MHITQHYDALVIFYPEKKSEKDIRGHDIIRIADCAIHNHSLVAFANS